MKVAERILKKMRLPNKQNKYQVQWKGSDELTWETEEGVHDFRELIDDYLYYITTGQRYGEDKLAELRLSYQNEYEILDNEYRQTIQENKKQQKEQKQLQKSFEFDQKLQRNSLDLISQKQKEIVNQITSQQVINDDIIEFIKIQCTTDSNLILQIQWKSRVDKIQPYSQFYSLDQFKQLFPLLYIQFIESCILECENEEMDLKFRVPEDISLIDLIQNDVCN